MRHFKIKALTPILLGSLITFFSCTETDDTPAIHSDSSPYTPVLMKREVLEMSISFQPAKVLQNAGKIYVYNDFLLVNERYEGIHVYDNKNPESPNKIGFIVIPGCIDMAIKESILYADNAVDLVAIDISQLPQIALRKRINNVFPEITPPGYNYIPFSNNLNNRPENTVIIKWEKI